MKVLGSGFFHQNRRKGLHDGNSENGKVYFQNISIIGRHKFTKRLQLVHGHTSIISNLESLNITRRLYTI